MAELVSVVIPYFNAGTFIEGAIESIRQQDYAPIEIILVDDGSSDNIAERVKSWGDIIFLQQPNKGAAAARNAGIRRAKGEFIAFLDADDLWPEGKLSLQIGRLNAEPPLDMVSGRIQYVKLEGAEDKPLKFWEEDKLRHVHLGAAVMRRRAFDKVGLFDESMRVHEDQDWYLRARELDIKLAIMKETTLIYHLHGDNLTRGQNMQDIRLLDVLKKSIERRKKQHGAAVNLKPFSEYDDE